jgi:hypothetical protein
MREVRDRQLGIANLRVEMARFVVRPLQERIEKSEFVHHFERRGVDGVAAEVPQEISMLFEDHDLYPRTGEKEAEHHAGRPSADDTAPDVYLSARRSGHRSIPSGAIMSA